MEETPYHRGLHVVAWVTACATFPLIFMGGLVTSKHAGMSVPDWPNSYGYNMFLFPPRLWTGGIKYEHLHRLMGSTVGMLLIVQTIWAWAVEKRLWVCWLITGVLLAVIGQGILGGLRVELVNLVLAVVHGCAAQAVFCLTVLPVVVTSKWWIGARETAKHRARPIDAARGKRLVRTGYVTLAVIFMQLIIGAVMRHYQAGLAIPDFPTSYGHWLPPTNQAELAAANKMRAWDQIMHMTLVSGPALEQVTMGQVWIHFAHRIGAVLVTIAVSVLAVKAILLQRSEKIAARAGGQKSERVRGLLGPAVVLIILLGTQLTLGILTVLLRKPADIATTHVAVGALTLVCAFVLTVRARRLYNPRVGSRGNRDETGGSLGGKMDSAGYHAGGRGTA